MIGNVFKGNTGFDFGLEISKGNVCRHSHIHKFGQAKDIDIADGFVDVWDGVDGTLSTGKISSYTFSTSADIDTISSSNATDDQDVEVQGLDANWNLIVQTKALDGRNKVTLDTPLIRVFRMKNEGTTDIEGEMYCYVDGNITAGVPDTAGDVRAIINNGNNQTLMSIYTIPNGKTGYLYNWYASISEKKDQISDVKLSFRKNGGVFQLKHSSVSLTAATSYIQHGYAIPEMIPGKTDIKMQGDSSKDNGAFSSGFDIILVDN